MKCEKCKKNIKEKVPLTKFNERRIFPETLSVIIYLLVMPVIIVAYCIYVVGSNIGDGVK